MTLVSTGAEGRIEERVAALERALAEKEREVDALRRELARFQGMVEHAPVGLVEDDGTGQCTYANEAWQRTMGLDRTQVVGRAWQTLFHPEDVAEIRSSFVASKKSGAPFVADYRIIRPDGVTRWVQGKMVPMTSPAGALVGYVGTILDITERVEARQELERSVALRAADLRKASDELRIFAALTDHATDAIVIASPEGDVTHVNGAYHRLFGDGVSVIGTPLVDAIRPGDAPAREALYAALVDGSTYRGTLTLRGANGAPLPAQVDCYVVRGGPEEVLGLAAIIRDLSEEQRAEVERAELEARVITSQEALIRELSTPLVPIAQGVIAMPLVGSIGDARAEQILEALLAGIQEHQAETAILDITGVPTVDTSAANALIAAAQAARLLGTKVIISGIGPAVARTLVELGVELGGTTTKSTLAAAIAEAVRGAGRRR
ncbi:PAS domain S-box protein [Polyangium sp. 6x1]|uniref:PAS domain S-box protein n=1 Tax=Polyangium sp. 6x1 TaxID=3042689 RepID=UPI0024825E7D|nr:PAS domain S-box protein [Polyangium sp. 6x1]MDI1446105.1 PAS domain S-box protein [Polyangium sp. 6x1]